MTVPEFAAFMRGFAAFHNGGGDEPSDDDWAAALADEVRRGRV